MTKIISFYSSKNKQILGEYLGRIYDKVKQRPIYKVKKVVGFDFSNKNINN